ncbi:hypothetical protein A5788_11210 [Gordonia sp. 852002-50816_SCH5313054-c]|uniref:LEM-3-like GIY-YIG domain-containing protein n=1 Tax=unclassified Gordonia (in: high G+C Gram-positive bacteria) TaxID=2657482 RepID=UPI0007EA17FB|nr:MULTISPECIES: hypothetical protein [unclassified Gordonia (in: high G+C Gram-positive bacteria)]OBC18060.1 hypothetical protein A5788_11210 [Gordonia sp. 852002-50816_SCH5313054-c]OBC18590.1 hypothetical protein A5786_17350 [Gordonia sp. 852002-50816_SCH5313054-a]
MITPDLPAQLPPGVAEKLGVYVYALRDPRDKSIFYIGKGKGDRVFSHVWVARGQKGRVKDGTQKDPIAVESAKNARINAIYADGSKVEHFILRPNITPPVDSDKLAFQFEQVLISAFKLAETDLENPKLTTIKGGHTSGEFVVEPIEETIKRLAAVPAGKIEKPFVVLVSTNPAYKTWSDEEIYDNVAGSWYASGAVGLPDLPILVVHAGLIRAVFRADRWEPSATEAKKWRFYGAVDPELDAMYRGKSLHYNDIDRDPPLAGWSTRGWHLYT